MTLRETVVSTKEIYNGSLIKVQKDIVRCANGVESSREIVRHAPAVVIIARDHQQRIVCIKQYRRAIDQVILECPAGCVSHNEDPLVAAKRELREETGYQASSWTVLHRAFPSPGFCDEVYHFFLAEGLTQTEQDLDHDEVVSICLIPQQDISSYLQSGSILDLKTLFAFYWLMTHKEGGQ